LSAVRIDRFDSGHVRRAVDVHIRAFPGFFLTSLGPAFLREFYRSFLEEKTAFGFVAVDDKNGACLGAVFGTTAPVGFFRKLAAGRWWAFGLAALGQVARRPSIIGRLVRGLSYRGDPPARPGYALLSSIAVSPEAQGRGIGRALLTAWVEEARARGGPGVYLTTDALDNDAVNSFYRTNGWSLESSFVTPEGRKMNRYVLSFAGGAS